MVGARTVHSKTTRVWIWSLLAVIGLVLYFEQAKEWEHYMVPVLAVLCSLGLLFFRDYISYKTFGAGAAFFFAMLLVYIAEWRLSIGSVGAVLFMLGWFALLAEKAKKWI